VKAFLELEKIKSKFLFPSAPENVFRETQEWVQEFRVPLVDAVARSHVDQSRLVLLHRGLGPGPGVLREGRDQERIAQNPFRNGIEKLKKIHVTLKWCNSQFKLCKQKSQTRMGFSFTTKIICLMLRLHFNVNICH